MMDWWSVSAVVGLKWNLWEDHFRYIVTIARASCVLFSPTFNWNQLHVLLIATALRSVTVLTGNKEPNQVVVLFVFFGCFIRHFVTSQLLSSVILPSVSPFFLPMFDICKLQQCVSRPLLLLLLWQVWACTTLWTRSMIDWSCLTVQVGKPHPKTAQWVHGVTIHTMLLLTCIPKSK